ncbi:MAG: glycosyltransferase family 4 protein [Patescibacteria group bacterium]|nr:glycosyltransferase family 4 protein [Patescibacteria group bacterium]
MSTAVLDRAVSKTGYGIASPANGVVRVLHVINGEHYAGAERVQDLLAMRLADLGFEVGFACLKRGQFAKVRQSNRARLHEVVMRNRFDLQPVAELVRIVRREGYQLIHAHTPRSAMVAGIVSKLTGVPMVSHVHSPVARDTTYGVRNWLNAMVERLSTRRASAMVAVSESLGGYLSSRKHAWGKVTVVPNGVPAATRPMEDREVPATWTLGVVALFRPRKGLEVLLHSLAKLRALGFSVRLRAVGRFETQEYEARIKALAHELKVDQFIDWVGFTERVDEELARMDLMILPSLFGEGMPMVVLEAMAAGVPVVATRVEGIPEAIRDGIDGVIAEPNNADDLARAIGLVVRGDVDYREMRRNARSRHAERFSDRAMAEGVARVYRRVLGA